MPASLGSACPLKRRSWRRSRGYLSPAVGAALLALLILHLLVRLAARFTESDPVSALSVVVGMAAVLVMLLPFAVLCARRAQLAWRRPTGEGNAAAPPGLAPDLG